MKFVLDIQTSRLSYDKNIISVRVYEIGKSRNLPAPLHAWKHMKYLNCVRFEVFTAVTMKNGAF
jgi:hypothetical protein